jgi:type I restriction enzyme S subunit
VNRHRALKLGDVCDVVSGATPKTGVAAFWDGHIPWATPADLSELEGAYLDDTPRKITSEGLASCSARVLPAGSVLLSSRAPIGHVAINTVPMATNQGFKSLVPKSGLADAKYLYHWLRFHKTAIQALGNGATFKEVSKSIVSDIAIDLPPLDEQRRIAAILDKADGLRQKRKRAIAVLDSLTQSIFAERFVKGYPPRQLGDLISEFRYGTSQKSGPTGHPVLRIPNILGGSILLDEIKTVELNDAEFRRLSLSSGDLLFVRTNGNPEYVGRSAVVDADLEARSGLGVSKFVFASYLIRARVNTNAASSIYIQAYLSSPQGRKAMLERSRTSAGQFNINIESLASIQIPLPPVDEQIRFEKVFRAVRTQSSSLRERALDLETLFSSLQSRAFSGTLT